MVKNKICLVCGNETFNHLLQLKDYSITQEDFTLDQCPKCKFVFTQNVPEESEAGRYYQSADYISHSDTNEGLINKAYHLVRKIMLSKKLKLIRSLSGSKEILDIGCGTGYFLNHMRENGYETLGVEADENTRKYGAEKFKLNILSPAAFKTGAIKSKFGFVTLWHVLEHLYDPKLYLSIIRDVLKKDGYLIIALPNKDSFDGRHYGKYWAGYDVPRHLWHFTPETFKPFAENAGFDIVKMNRLPFDSFYVSMLSEKYKKSNLGLLKGAWIGLISFLKSWMNAKHTSSVIYVLQKKEV